jgi:hypothetical protein
MVPQPGTGAQYNALPVSMQPPTTVQQQFSNMMPQVNGDYLAMMNQMSSQLQQLQQHYIMQQVQQQQQVQGQQQQVQGQQQQQFGVQQPLPAATYQAAAVQAAPVLGAAAAQAPVPMEQQQKSEQIAPTVPQPTGAYGGYSGAAGKAVEKEQFPSLGTVQSRNPIFESKSSFRGEHKRGMSSARGRGSSRGQSSHRGGVSPYTDHRSRRDESESRMSSSSRRENSQSSQQRDRTSNWQRAGKRKSQADRKQEVTTSYNRPERPMFSKQYQPWNNRHLQSLLHDRPIPPHPTEQQLAEVKPGDYRKIGDIFYCKSNEGQLVVMQQGSHHAEQCTLQSTKLIHEYGLTTPVSDITECSELPRVSSELPDSWLHNPNIFYKPRSTVNLEHRGRDTECYCPPTTGDYVQSNVISTMCFKREYCEKSDHVVQFEQREEHFLPNSGRVYVWSVKSRRAVVQVPSPFLLSWRWQPKPYMAANAQEASNTWRMKLFYALASSQANREINEPFMQEPGQWDSSMHPTWQEPSRQDELSNWSRPLYGSESLNRVLFVQHPARSSEIKVYAAMSRSFEVPVLLNNEQPEAVESFLKIKLRPFYSQGFGKVICPICIFSISEERPTPSAYSRVQFINHFVKEHHRNLHVLGLGFATQYHCRLHQALILYHFCVAHNTEDQVDNVYRAPFSSEQMEDMFEMKTSTEIKELLATNYQEALLTPSATRSYLFGWAEEEHLPVRRPSKSSSEHSEQKMEEDQPAASRQDLQAAAPTMSEAATLNSVFVEAAFMGAEQASPNGLQMYAESSMDPNFSRQLPEPRVGYPIPEYEQINTP